MMNWRIIDPKTLELDKPIVWLETAKAWFEIFPDVVAPTGTVVGTSDGYRGVVVPVSHMNPNGIQITRVPR